MVDGVRVTEGFEHKTRSGLHKRKARIKVGTTG